MTLLRCSVSASLLYLDVLVKLLLSQHVVPMCSFWCCLAAQQYICTVCYPGQVCWLPLQVT